MANAHTTLTELFTDISAAIKEKKGTTEAIVADTFPAEIENLKTGFDYINSDVTEIPDYAFYGCEDLKSFDCYNITSIGANAFENCTGLKSVVLYEGVTSIGENAFQGCSEDLAIYCEVSEKPDGWSENWNPDGCGVIYVGTPVETWNISANSEDNVVATLYSDGYMIIKGHGNMQDFYYIVEPNDGYRTTIPWYSKKSQIKQIIIQNGVENIGNYTFYDCNSLELINIPDSITSIGKRTFYKCKSLTSVILRSNKVCVLNDLALHYASIESGTGYIYVPSSLIEDYKTAENWSNYATQFRPLEDYTVDGTINGELDWDKVNAAEKELIAFYIHINESVEYTAEEGMTWEEWLNSDYNTTDLYIDTDNTVSTDSTSLFNGENTAVQKDDVIISGEIYVSLF